MSQMLINTQVIGLGAAGNKAAVNLHLKKCIDEGNIMLINTTDKDIPDGFKVNSDSNPDGSNRGIYHIIGDGIGGCGQERSKGREIALNALQGSLGPALERFIKPTTEMIVLITSTEGGTGSGSSTIIAKYIKEVLNVNVMVFAITGFEQAARAIWNTIEFFKDMQENYHIEILRNKNFLADCRGNESKAEAACNDEIATRFKVLTGQVIEKAAQNIDARDLKKLSMEVGWGNVEYRTIDEKIKNVQQFNDILNDMIDETKSMDPVNPAQKRLGVIISLSEKEQDAIDYNFGEIRDKYGIPYELYKHIQCESSERFIAFISTGMNLPLEDLQKLYSQYEEATSNVNKAADKFFSQMSTLQQASEDSMFDMKDNSVSATERQKAANDFFSAFKKTAQPRTDVAENNEPSSSNVTNVREDMKNY